MANYRITQRNGIFTGAPGELVAAEPGPLLDAAVKAGILTRLADDEVVESKTSRKKKSDGGDDS